MVDKFIFHKDQFDVHVFYAGMNPAPRGISGKLKINETVNFDPSVDCVVPPVTRVSSSEQESQVMQYKSNVDGSIMTVPVYHTRAKKLETAAHHAYPDVADEVAAQVEWRRFQEEWEEESTQVEVHTDYEFEIIDIEYPADERLIPLRHLDNERVNYFQVDGEQVALNLARKLCEDEGLKEDGHGTKRGTYHIPTYGHLQYWEIENTRYGGPTEKLNFHDFTGDLDECRNYIHKIERCVRGCFDEWVISGKQPDGLTVGKVTKHLDKIYAQVQRIDSKIKTRGCYDAALNLIRLVREEIVLEGTEQLLKEED